VHTVGLLRLGIGRVRVHLLLLAMHAHGGHQIHSDGLVYEGAVGCGACSAVLICLLDDDKCTKSKAVGCYYV